MDIIPKTKIMTADNFMFGIFLVEKIGFETRYN